MRRCANRTDPRYRGRRAGGSRILSTRLLLEDVLRHGRAQRRTLSTKRRM